MYAYKDLSDRISLLKLTLFIFSIIVFNHNLKAQYKNIQIDYFGQQPPGNKAVVFSPDFICTPDKFIQNCCFSQDGKEFVYAVTGNNWGTFTIMYTKNVNGKWTTPVPLPTKGNTGLVPYFSYDGNSIYMVINKYNNSKSADIYVCYRTADGWSDPESLGTPVNSDSNEWEVCISKNNVLYFSSNRPGGYGNIDICSAELVKGKFTNFRNLGIPINTNSLDECPYIAPDESFMIFNDWKTNPQFQGNNLYITYRKENGTWTNPKCLNANINTNYLDIYPYITPDGKYLIYTIRDKSRSALTSKLYWVSTKFVDSLRHTNFEPYCKNPITSLTATSGKFFSYQIPDSMFVDDDENDTLTYSVNGMPSWMSFDAKTKTFTGTPLLKSSPVFLSITVTDLTHSTVTSKVQIITQDPTDVENEHSSIESLLEIIL